MLKAKVVDEEENFNSTTILPAEWGRNNESVQNGTTISAIYYRRLIYLTDQQRIIFMAVYLGIYCVIFFGNIAAVIVTWTRQHRYLQKTCIISLAVADLVTGTFIVVHNLQHFIIPVIIWVLGSAMCHLVPAVQVFGILCSSIAVVAIALDRYNNVARKKKYDPPLWVCLITVILIWAACAAISYPIATLFRLRSMLILYFSEDGTYPILYPAYLCISTEKDGVMWYRITVTVIVFFPLVVIFCWLYYKVAYIVWKHRKPLLTNISGDSKSSPSETESSYAQSNETSSKYISETRPKSIMKKRRLGVERKVRTFKIIIVLVFAFISCRLPFWIFDILRVVETLNENKHWIMRYAFNALNLLNCALNPFLYVFLNQTINAGKKIFNAVKDFVCKICCCFCSAADFEELENENPFMIGTYEKKSSTQCPKGERATRVKFKDSNQHGLAKNVNRY